MSKNWSLAIVVAFVLGYGLKAYLDMQEQVKAEQAQAKIDAMLVDPVFYGEDNQPVHIFDKDDDRTRIVYFGYTRCPDVCPTSLAMLSGALNQFDEEQLSHFRPMFISIDPERDDAASAHQYAQYFHPTIEGLSAPLELTKPVADKFGVIFRKTELEDSAIGYVVDHSSYFYFLKPDGSLITSVPHTLEPTPIAVEIQKLLNK
ncbi:SCO family protein [Vibrio sp. HN007]|uniref:SCO family protein n=1 Tax=Vibrio iocasae TaxID=3098914 RepID=UPI0035D47C09